MVVNGSSLFVDELVQTSTEPAFTLGEEYKGKFVGLCMRTENGSENACVLFWCVFVFLL